MELRGFHSSSSVKHFCFDHAHRAAEGDVCCDVNWLILTPYNLFCTFKKHRQGYHTNVPAYPLYNFPQPRVGTNQKPP